MFSLLNLLNLLNPFANRGKTYVFHMRGGQSIRVPNIVELTMKSDNAGTFVGYQIKWADGRQPEFFSLSLPDISAVTVE